MSTENWNNLIEELNVRGPVPYEVSAKFLSSGKPMYEFLWRRLVEGSLRKWQTSNVLVLLYSMRLHGNTDDLLARLLELGGDPRLPVRQAAINLVIGWYKGELAGGRRPESAPTNWETLQPAFAALLTQGIEPQSLRTSVEWFLEEEFRDPKR